MGKGGKERMIPFGDDALSWLIKYIEFRRKIIYLSIHEISLSANKARRLHDRLFGIELKST